MANAVNFSQIEAQINTLHHNVSKVASWYRNRSDHYTPEGIKAKYADAIKDQRHNYQGKAQQLAQLIDNLTPAAQAQVAQARASALPVATDPTEQLAAEMQAHRLMSRPGLEAIHIMELISESEPSPGLTLAMQEWQARGQLSEEYADAALQEMSPEYRDAQAKVGQVTQLAGMLRQRLDKTTEQMQTTQPVDTEYVPTVEIALGEGWIDSVNVDELPAEALGEVTIDPVYRAE